MIMGSFVLIEVVFCPENFSRALPEVAMPERDCEV
jgi:hypothetical protein